MDPAPRPRRRRRPPSEADAVARMNLAFTRLHARLDQAQEWPAVQRVSTLIAHAADGAPTDVAYAAILHLALHCAAEMMRCPDPTVPHSHA